MVLWNVKISSSAVNRDRQSPTSYKQDHRTESLTEPQPQTVGLTITKTSNSGLNHYQKQIGLTQTLPKTIGLTQTWPPRGFNTNTATNRGVNNTITEMFISRNVFVVMLWSILLWLGRGPPRSEPGCRVAGVCGRPSSLQRSLSQQHHPHLGQRDNGIITTLRIAVNQWHLLWESVDLENDGECCYTYGTFTTIQYTTVQMLLF